jgi:hypothetical protein
MALPDYFKNEHGTAVIWGEAGATGGSRTVTDTLSLNNLAAAAGRQGASVDLGTQWDEEHLVQQIWETGTAPTAGGVIKLYMVTSDDNTSWAGGVTGSDSAFTTANVGLIGTVVVPLEVTNSGNTALIRQPVIWRPQGRYVVPVVINGSDQAGRNQGTASDNLSRVIMVPRRALIQETA